MCDRIRKSRESKNRWSVPLFIGLPPVHPPSKTQKVRDQRQHHMPRQVSCAFLPQQTNTKESPVQPQDPPSYSSTRNPKSKIAPFPRPAPRKSWITTYQTGPLVGVKSISAANPLKPSCASSHQQEITQTRSTVSPTQATIPGGDSHDPDALRLTTNGVSTCRSPSRNYPVCVRAPERAVIEASQR
ncbi:hypothetical protein B0T14DRAFT_123425 [Immersiella caudata]|uniref:Uncharacterized protein n=1 Tax=Immersiella caudata TaxID=314043 RepID=A0AA40C706_9PEZI|nr:hypothetical protein B0T14DRAFT_123425 [Immersiella caudata]